MSMWGAGIGWMLMGSIYFLKKPLKLNLDGFASGIYKMMFIVGCIVFGLSIVDIFLDHMVFTVLPLLPILFACIWVMKRFRDWRIANEVMEKLDKE